MSINTKIVDGGGTRKTAEVAESIDNGRGLKVFTYDGITKTNSARTSTNNIYGIEMNIGGTITGTPDNVHNGTDNTYWTGSILSGAPGEFIFNSTDQAQSGTRSINATGSDNNDQAIFTISSTIDLSNYTSVSGGIHIISWPTSGTDKNVRFYFRNGGTAVGTEVSLSSYINIGIFNTWQNFKIPLSAFSLGSTIVDELVMRTVDIGGGAPPDYYIDELKINDNSSSAEISYSIAPSLGEVWEVNNLGFVFADQFAGTLSNGTMPAIPYDSILGVPALSNGVLLRRIQNEEVLFSSVMKDTLEFIGGASETSFISGSDGTNTWMKITRIFPGTFLLIGDLNDRLEIVIQDDLRGLLRMRTTSGIQIITKST